MKKYKKKSTKTRFAVDMTVKEKKYLVGKIGKNVTQRDWLLKMAYHWDNELKYREPEFISNMDW